MQKKISRRTSLKAMTAGLGYSIVGRSNTPSFKNMNQLPHAKPSLKSYEAVIIGSGFGGAITSCRLAKSWGDKVLILERGRRYEKGSFPRGIRQLANHFWRQKGDGINRPINLPGNSEGIFDLRSFKKMDTLVGAGFGGTSLIYAAALIRPSFEGFDDDWPTSIRQDRLDPYYSTVRQTLSGGQVPTNETNRELNRHDLFKAFIESKGEKFQKCDLGIYFGDENSPSDFGKVSRNKFGMPQESCRYCAECVLGCNFHAKNSLDLNYLYVAEKVYRAEVRTSSLAIAICPLNAQGAEDPESHGEHGYHVYTKDLTRENTFEKIKTRRIIVSAGTYGSTELLLKSRDFYGKLPHLSQQLGKKFSGNGDFMNLVFGGEKENGANFGPTVTLFSKFTTTLRGKKQRFLLEDFSYPRANQILYSILNAANAKSPRLRSKIDSWNKIRDVFRTAPNDDSFMTVLLAVGLDSSDGQLYLNNSGDLRLQWSSNRNKDLYEAMINVAKEFKEFHQGISHMPLPNYIKPFRRSFTVHPLGGCCLAESPDLGVVSSNETKFGQAFGYKNLFVADGSIIPSALGANPALTIAALAERVAEGITGEAPTPQLF